MTVTNTSIESLPADTIGSLIYGDFRNSKFHGLYTEAGVCSDGAQIVLSNESKHNEFWLAEPFKSTYKDDGFWNTFHSGIGELVNVNFDGMDLGTWGGVPKWINSTHPTATFPPTSDLYHQYCFVSSTVGTTYTAAPGNTINGQPSLIVGIDEVYLVGGLFQAPSTDLKALQIK